MKNLNFETLETLCQQKDRERRKRPLLLFLVLLTIVITPLIINLIKDGDWQFSKMLITFTVIILVMMYLLFVFLSAKQRLRRYFKQKPNASVQEAYEFLFKDDLNE